MATKRRENPCSDLKICTHEQIEESGRNPRPFFAGLTTPWEEFYRSQTERLSRMATKMDVPTNQIEDVVSEAWLDAVRHRGDFSTESGLRCWLTIAVRHKAVDLFRHKDREVSELSMSAWIEGLMDGKAAYLRSRKEERELLCLLLKRLRSCKPKDAPLLNAHYLKGRTLQDLAQKRRMTVDAIRNRIGRALQELRRQSEEKASP